MAKALKTTPGVADREKNARRTKKELIFITKLMENLRGVFTNNIGIEKDIFGVFQRGIH